MSPKTNLVGAPGFELPPEEQVSERKPLSYEFEKELIEKQTKRTYILKEFVPTGRERPLTLKFYARHDEKQPDYTKYLDFVEPTQLKRRTSLNLPRLESQVLGWLPESLQNSACLKELNIIVAPKQRCSMTAYGEKLVSETVTQRPAFNGLRFFLR